MFALHGLPWCSDNNSHQAAESGRPPTGHFLEALLLCCLQVLLAALPEADGSQGDGYLCREQEGEMKFMLAFREPSRALEWCLLVQVGGGGARMPACCM